MKKILSVVISVLILSLGAFANDKDDVQNVFNKYVQDANSYSPTLANYYFDDAKILRVVNKKQGGQKTVTIPFERYVKELKSHSKLAKTVNYKNSYINQKIAKVDKGYKVSATRVPRNDKNGLPCYFLFVKNSNGEWKIKEESMTTNVQTFLYAK